MRVIGQDVQLIATHYNARCGRLRRAMVGKSINAIFKVSIIAAVALASVSVAYYYFMYLPARDARLDAAKQVLEQRLDAEKRASERRQNAEKLEAQVRYQTCLSVAESNYNSTWAANCRATREEMIKRHAVCVEGELGFGLTPDAAAKQCDSIQKNADAHASTNCTLPKYIADELSAALNADRNRCLQESKSGL